MEKTIYLILLAVSLAACANGQSPQNSDPNTIVVTKDSKKYQLTAIGDNLPKFYVNDQLIAKERFEDYEPIFSDLQNQLEARKQKLGQKAQLFTEERRINLVADLIKDKMIASGAELTSFKLDANNFVVNGRNQSFAVFARYKDKYLSGSNFIIQFN